MRAGEYRREIGIRIAYPVSLFEIGEDGLHRVVAEIETPLPLQAKQAVGKDRRTACSGTHYVGFHLLARTRTVGGNIGTQVGLPRRVGLPVGTQYLCAPAQAHARLTVCNARYHTQYAVVVLNAEVYGLEIGVARQKPALAILVLVIDLYRCLAVERGDDKVSVVGGGAGGYNQFVTLTEVKIAHRLTVYGYDESRLAGKLPRDGYGLVGVVAGADGQTCPYTACKIRHLYPIHYL